MVYRGACPGIVALQVEISIKGSGVATGDGAGAGVISGAAVGAAAGSTVGVAAGVADVSRNSLAFRYYVIVGAFGNRGNAEKYAEEMNTKGMPAVLISYVNGFTAVGVCPTDNITEAYASLRRVRESGSCPDAWILDNR